LIIKQRRRRQKAGDTACRTKKPRFKNFDCARRDRDADCVAARRPKNNHSDIIVTACDGFAGGLFQSSRTPGHLTTTQERRRQVLFNDSVSCLGRLFAADKVETSCCIKQQGSYVVW
jgi:hypothetical protein